MNRFIFIDKSKAILYHFSYLLLSYPKRVKRLIFHPFNPDSYQNGMTIFLIEWLLLFLDCCGLPELLQICYELFNWNLRSLSKQEIQEFYPFFKNSISWKNVRINSNDFLFAKKLNICYVTFYTVNFYKNISIETLIHELVHVWQFEKFGSTYIVRSLLAQRSTNGYDYGGSIKLKEYMGNKHLLEFNYEQMAEIIKDGYEVLKLKKCPPETKSIYHHYINYLTE